MRFGIDHFHFQHCKSPSRLLDTVHSDMSAVIIDLSLSVMSYFSLTAFRIFFSVSLAFNILTKRYQGVDIWGFTP